MRATFESAIFTPQEDDRVSFGRKTPAPVRVYNWPMSAAQSVSKSVEPSKAAGASRKRSVSGIQVIARAAEILRLLGEKDGLSLAGIAEGVGLPRSTVHRIILALEREGLASTTGPGKFRLGPQIAYLAEVSRPNPISDLHPFMVRLSAELNETVDLSIPIGNTVTFVDQIIAMRRLRAVSALGKAFPLHCTANGKAVLAAMPESLFISSLPQKLEIFTPTTARSRDDLAASLEEVRKTGIAFDREEHTSGVCAVGACFRVSDKEIIAVSVPLPGGRFYGHEQRLTQTLKTAMLEVEVAYPHIKALIGRNAPGVKKMPSKRI